MVKTVCHSAVYLSVSVHIERNRSVVSRTFRRSAQPFDIRLNLFGSVENEMKFLFPNAFLHKKMHGPTKSGEKVSM